MPKTTKTKNKTALVTGGAGFIGSHLVDRLIAEGFTVAVVDDLTNGRREYLHPDAHFYKISITDPKLGIVFAAEKPETVFHLAAHIDARVSVEDPIHDAEVNVHGSLRVLKECLKHGVKKIIFSSSGGAIYHDTKKFPTPETEAPSPLTPYGVSKLAFEYYLETAAHHYGLSYVALRYANVYGPRQDQKGEGGVIGVFCKMLKDGKTPKIFGDGKQTRDFVYVGDVVDANMKAMRAKESGAYHIATGKETNVKNVAALIAKEYGWNGVFGRGPTPAGDVRRSCLKPHLAKKKLGWQARVKIQDGIKHTVAWFKTR
ncbi:MAG: NAD-dependent epimerase/dehydratase family protein [Patescibacteria group bacterium]|jgi:UDP-glucose 4-epimerase